MDPQINPREDLKVHVQTQDGELTIRYGEAPKIKEPKQIIIEGQIETPLSYLRKRDHFNMNDSTLYSNFDQGSIFLVTNESSVSPEFITGRIESSPEMELFKINTGTEFDHLDLADFLRMNKFHFKDKNKGAELVKQLKNFEAEVNQTMEKLSDNRGNFSNKKNQAVKSNLPDEFVLLIPVFKGEKKEEIKVEIDINPDNLNCKLVSPDAKLIMDGESNRLLHKQLELIMEEFKDLLIVFV